MGTLENAAALREPPRESLAIYLHRLTCVLEALKSLEYRVVDRQLVSDEAIPRLRRELLQLAEQGFANALATRPSQVSAWVRGLDPLLQRPPGIDYDAWAAKADALPDPVREAALPVASERLQALIAECRRRWPAPSQVGAPLPETELRARLDLLHAPLHDDLIALCRLARRLDLPLSSWGLELSELAHAKPPALRLWTGSGTAFADYSFVVATDGAVMQRSSWREGSRYTLEKPIRVAESITSFLEAVLSNERLDAQGGWSPGSLLPLPGEAPKPRPPPSRADIARARREQRLTALEASGLPSLETADGLEPTVERALQRIEAWVETHAPELASALGRPAEPEAIGELEKIAGGPLPSEVRAWYALHDGLAFSGGSLGPLFRGHDFLPIGAALSEYARMRSFRDWDCDALGPVKAAFFHERWFPFTLLFGESHYHCLDFDPEPGGIVGQVIRVDDDDFDRIVIAPDLGHYLTRYARALERGWAQVDARGGVRLHRAFQFVDE